jgi:hypothetical protein
MKKSYLCVGGPKAGEHVAAEGSFKVAVPKHRYQVYDSTIDTVIYHEQEFQTKEETFTVWVPSNQTAQQTIELLLETYEIYRCRR